MEDARADIRTLQMCLRLFIPKPLLPYALDRSHFVLCSQEAELVEVQVPKDRKVKMMIDLLAKYVAEVRWCCSRCCCFCCWCCRFCCIFVAFCAAFFYSFADAAQTRAKGLVLFSLLVAAAGRARL